ncbi:PqqD family peptide modification chaperone [Mesorhizobium sp. M1227]|uniref:PqqD family peptide modification chaperone n=1 Tax=Mesorhizobium sp. M1227 TaxID=2957071 RepID=UPI00333BCA93
MTASVSPQQTRTTDRTAGPPLVEYATARLVPQGRLACIKGQNILLSSTQGVVFALNDTAADIWRSLEEGVPVQAILGEMAARGVDRQEAYGYVEAALQDWERLGLIQPAPPPCPTAAHQHICQVVAVPGVCVRILYPAAVAFPAATVFQHLEVRNRAVDVLFHLVERGQRIHLFRDGHWTNSCGRDQIPIMVKGQLLAEVLGHSEYELALHAAALFKNGRTLLLCGNPGSGKTTLTLALVHAGFGFAADDVTLLDSAGQSIGLAFAPSVKSGSWSILGQYFPELGRSRVYRRPDRRRVRFLVPRDHVPTVPRPVGWVVLLCRTQDAKPSLRVIDPSEILGGLLNGAFARNKELSSTAFDALCQVIRSAEGFCLTYAKLGDGLELLKAACR